MCFWLKLKESRIKVKLIAHRILGVKKHKNPVFVKCFARVWKGEFPFLQNIIPIMNVKKIQNMLTGNNE